MTYKANKITKEDFHKHLIPNDSSYCVNMKTKEDSNLVGLKVKIISIPFTMEVQPMGKGTRMSKDDKKTVLCCIYCLMQILYCFEACSSPTNCVKICHS